MGKRAEVEVNKRPRRGVQGHGIEEGKIRKEVEGQIGRGGGGGGGKEANKRPLEEKVEGKMGRGGGREGNKRPQGEEFVGQMERGVGRDGNKRPRGDEVVGQMGRGIDRPDGNKRPQGEGGVRQEQRVVKDGNNGKKLQQDDVVGKQFERGDGGKQELDDNGANGKQGNSLGLPWYRYEYLSRITGNFDTKKKIGNGGFATVYKARLRDRTRIAIKCLKPGRRIDDFKNEVDALAKADHPNLVKFIGYCAEGNERLLVYEYMRNGSLEKWIFHKNPKKSLTWPEMKNIIQGIAQGLVYLHEKSKKTILHRDLKPHNVVLDENKNAKLCDFGIAKFLNKDQTSTSTIEAGTEKYKAPEVKQNMRITDKVDVYSFGIVVLEVIFGEHYRNYISLNQYTKKEDVKVNDLMANTLSEEMQRNGKEIEKFGKIAVWCLRENPVQRPTMSEVLSAIQGIDAKPKRN